MKKSTDNFFFPYFSSPEPPQENQKKRFFHVSFTFYLKTKNRRVYLKTVIAGIFLSEYGHEELEEEGA